MPRVVSCCRQAILSLPPLNPPFSPSHPPHTTPGPVTIRNVLETGIFKKCVCSLSQSEISIHIPSRHALPSRSPDPSLTHPTEAKDIRDNAVLSRSVTPMPSRPTTPKPPGTVRQQAHLRSGMLTVRIFSGASPLSLSGRALTEPRPRSLACTGRAGPRGHPKSPRFVPSSTETTREQP